MVLTLSEATSFLSESWNRKRLIADITWNISCLLVKAVEQISFIIYEHGHGEYTVLHILQYHLQDQCPNLGPEMMDSCDSLLVICTKQWLRDQTLQQLGCNFLWVLNIGSPYFVTWLYEKSVLSWQWSVLRPEGNRGIRQKYIVHVYSHMEEGNEGRRMERVDSIESSNVRFVDSMGLLLCPALVIFNDLQLDFSRKLKI